MTRRFRPGRGSRLALLLGGLVAALVAAPSASADCASLRGVEAFKGYVSETVGAADSASYPAIEGGGTQTVQLGRFIGAAKVHYGDKKDIPEGAGAGHEKKIGELFNGRINGGNVMTDDVFEDTGTGDLKGELKYSGPLINDGGANANGGGLLLDRRECSYKLGAHFFFEAEYSGDPHADLGHWVSMGAFSSTKSIPENLKLDGHIDLLPRLDFPNEPTEGGAIVLDSPWMGDLITLFECESPEPTGNCIDNPNPEFQTPAFFSWHLRPVFEKKPKKKPPKKKNPPKT